MIDEAYTLGVWHVKDGRQQEFIDAMRAMGKTFASLPDPLGKGTLVQSVTDPTQFYSFGPWNSMEAIEAMRNDSHSKEALRKVMELCTEGTLGACRVVAQSS